MLNKDKSLLIIIPVLMIGVGVFVLGSMNDGLQKTLSAFTLHSSFLSDAKDGTSPPDYRVVDNHREENTKVQKQDVILPKNIAEATEHRCGVLIKRLDEGRLLGKFDVGYMMICFDKYPSLFHDYFKEFMDGSFGKNTPKVKAVTAPVRQQQKISPEVDPLYKTDL